MDLGMSGTRKGTTHAQQDTAKRLMLSSFRSYSEFHHGDCIGADAEIAGIAEELGMWVVSHPPDNDRFRAFSTANYTFKPEGYLARNRSIVYHSDYLLIFPKESEGQSPSKGGTWYTFSYALSVSKAVVVVWPDGRTDRF